MDIYPLGLLEGALLCQYPSEVWITASRLLRSAYEEAALGAKQHGSVHAIAMCNIAELTGGTMTDVTVPPSHRWILKGMTVEYLEKAEMSLRAVANFDPIPEFGEPAEWTVTVDVIDANSQAVLRAIITMWISPKKP